MGKARLKEILGSVAFCRQAGAGAMLGRAGRGAWAAVPIRSAELQGVCLPGTGGKEAFANPNPALNPPLTLLLALNLNLSLSLSLNLIQFITHGCQHSCTSGSQCTGRFQAGLIFGCKPRDGCSPLEMFKLRSFALQSPLDPWRRHQNRDTESPRHQITRTDTESLGN